MDNHEKNIVACALLGLGIITLCASYFLPVFSGFIFSDKVLHGWEVALFTLGGVLNVSDGELEAILAGLFLSNLVLVMGVVIFFLRRSTFRWYKIVLALSLLYVLSVSIFVLNPDPGTFKAGYYTYLSSFVLIGTALFMKSKQRGKTAN